jgi:hypothetical protein
MQVQEIKTGMQVVATNLSNATVYTVKAINNFSVKLMFTVNGTEIDAGDLDARFLNTPTFQQLANA